MKKKWVDNLNRYFFKDNIQMANMYMKICSTLVIIREMQINTLMKCYHTPVRMAIIKKAKKNNKHWPECEKKESTRSWQEGKLVTFFKSIMEVPQKIKNTTAIWSSNSTTRYFLEKTETLIKKYMCTFMFTEALFTIAKI